MLENSFPSSNDALSHSLLNSSNSLSVMSPESGLPALNVSSNRVTASASQADLWIESLTAPTASVPAGNLFALNYAIKNLGNATAVASNTQFYLSSDTLLNVNTDTYISSDRVSNLAAGGLSTKALSLRINGAQAPGNYYLLAVADGDGAVSESNETNNITTTTLTVTKPDLIINSLSITSPAVVGANVNLSYSIRNQGDASALGSTTKFYLSSDNVLNTTTDTLLGSDKVLTLAAGTTSNETATLALSSSFSLGNYYLFAVADGDSFVGEGNEGNNVLAQGITLTQPDLTINSTTTPAATPVGTSLSVNYSIRNQGTAAAPTTTTKFYLSADNILDTTTDTALGTDQVLTLAAGATSNETVKLTFASTFNAGNYSLFAVADSAGSTIETNETNNTFSQAIALTKPDLLINGISTATTVAVGGSLDISYNLVNQGNDSAVANTTHFYLSTDNVFSAATDLKIVDDTVISLAAGTTRLEKTSYLVDPSVSLGNYYLFAVADGYQQVAESNENNNVALFSSPITIAKTDLTIASLNTPTTVTAGGLINLDYQISNLSNLIAAPSSTSFFLSTDTTLDASDLLFGNDPSDGLAGGTTRVETVTLTLANTQTAGTYYLFAVADYGGGVSESNENNNQIYQTLAVTVGSSPYSSSTGYGLINAADAVARGLGQTPFADVANLGGNNWGADLIKAPEVWSQGYTGQGIVVAVLDTGVDRTHSDLAANIWTNSGEIANDGLDNDGNGYVDDVFGWNFDGNNNNTLDLNNHGTHVSGTIAGVKNSVGVTGIAYNAKIMPVKVLNDSGSGYSSSIANGIYYAVDNGARVINMSLGGTGAMSNVEAAIQYAASKGVVVVSAAGNSNGATPEYPGYYALTNGIVVGAVDSTNTLASFSNRSGSDRRMLYVTAPGVNIYSTTRNNAYASLSGTSMATPHVAGVVALMLGANPNLTPSQVRQILSTPLASGTSVKTLSRTTLAVALSQNTSTIAPFASNVLPEDSIETPLLPEFLAPLAVSSPTIDALLDPTANYRSSGEVLFKTLGEMTIA